ncbi:MAG: hypothetical protein ACO3E4_03550 [Candidatus Nanopelagicaceae bacterium]
MSKKFTFRLELEELLQALIMKKFNDEGILLSMNQYLNYLIQTEYSRQFKIKKKDK